MMISKLILNKYNTGKPMSKGTIKERENYGTLLVSHDRSVQGKSVYLKHQCRSNAHETGVRLNLLFDRRQSIVL